MEAVHLRPPDQPEPPGRPESASESTAHSREMPTTDFVTCYELHYRRLMRALVLAGADRSTAEDVAQEAFARALVHWWRVRRGPNPPGYVYTAGFRLLGKAQRRLEHERARVSTRELPDAPSSEPAGEIGERDEVGEAGEADPTGSQATANVTLASALAAMPPRRRACAVICLVVGLPVGEAGEALGIADGTVRKHLEEARKDLAAVLGAPAG